MRIDVRGIWNVGLNIFENIFFEIFMINHHLRLFSKHGQLVNWLTGENTCICTFPFEIEILYTLDEFHSITFKRIYLYNVLTTHLKWLVKIK